MVTKLSEPKRSALETIAEAGVYRAFSSGTLASLERAGFIKNVSAGHYRVTDAGRAYLAASE